MLISGFNLFAQWLWEKYGMVECNMNLRKKAESRGRIELKSQLFCRNILKIWIPLY